MTAIDFFEQLNAATSPAKNIFRLAGLDTHLRYAYVAESLLVAGVPRSQAWRFNENRNEIRAIVSGFRCLPEIRLLDTLRVDDSDTGVDIYSFTLGDPPMGLSLQGALSSIDKDTLATILEASAADRAILVSMLRRDNPCWLIDAQTHQSFFSTGDIYIVGGEPAVKPVSQTWNRNVEKFWDLQDLLDFTRDLFQAGKLQAHAWRSKGTTSELEPTEQFFLQRGTVEIVTFRGRLYRLVEMLAPPEPWKGQVR